MFLGSHICQRHCWDCYFITAAFLKCPAHRFENDFGCEKTFAPWLDASAQGMKSYPSVISVLEMEPKPSVYTPKEGLICAVTSQPPLLVPGSQQSFRGPALSSAESPACNLGVTAWSWTHSKIEWWTRLTKEPSLQGFPKGIPKRPHGLSKENKSTLIHGSASW